MLSSTVASWPTEVMGLGAQDESWLDSNHGGSTAFCKTTLATRRAVLVCWSISIIISGPHHCFSWLHAPNLLFHHIHLDSSQLQLFPEGETGIETILKVGMGDWKMGEETLQALNWIKCQRLARLESRLKQKTMSSFWVHWITGCSACLLRPGWIWPQQQRLHWELTAQFGASESPESPCFVSIGHTDVTQIYLDDLRCFCACIPAVVMIEMRLLECFVWSMDPVRLRSIVSFSCVYSLMCDLLWRSHNEVHDIEALLRTASGHCNLANSSQWKIRLQRQGASMDSSIVRSKGRIWCFWFDKTFAVGAVWRSCVPRIPKISQDSLLILLFDNFNTLFNVS